MKITNFKIKKLHGYKNYNLKFKDNTLILVGENGAGKTTVLRMLFYTLTDQWDFLLNYDFYSISLKINDETITFKRNDISKPFKTLDKKLLRHLPLRIRREFNEMMNSRSCNSYSKLEILCDRYHIPFSLLLHYMKIHELDRLDDSSDAESDKLNKIRKHLLKTQVLYLPTYRRIEQELSTIFKGFDENEFRKMNINTRNSLLQRKNQSHIELVEFGMKDVDDAINRTLEDLKDFTRKNLNSLTLRYLGDVVEKKYDEVNVAKINDATEETVKNILGRIESRILSPKSKEHLENIIQRVRDNRSLEEVHDKVICHYFTKLLDFQQELEKKEENIRKFCEVCTSYMIDKEFEYTSSSFSFKIILKSRNDEGGIDLNQLSSGEKQIVSLLSHLYLSDQKNFFVLIDEPELSLSVPWQRKLLVDIGKGDFCSGILAVTHSPFIYDNELEKYAHGLGEFMTQESRK